MCSHLLKMMENYQGDLADIVRATTSAAAIDGGSTPSQQSAAPDWQFSRNSINYPPEYFGDPFSYIRDPLTPNMDTPPPVSELLYNSSIVNGTGVINPDEMKRPSNIFSRMLQISPNAKLQPCDPQAAAPPQRGLKNPPILVSNNGGLISPTTSALQISSPRNTGIKRRKSQAKKVVCIPAPAPANSRATGEVVPSDLWAWRKYGQKPIKGSPYPRGYYRCSSSKGCSARKQVERSRTDPNMLVITYTSEHNHPWPTQRNALAGSTRSQAAKNTKDSSQKPTNQSSSAAVKLEELPEFELPDSSSNHQHDSFFADLAEIGDDPLNLFGPHDNNDPFSFYDWPTTTTTADDPPRNT
ncbi:probable WRKY transcription factor 14 [Salvia miltiorrhiza]|uniref:probable WRKY transcription factor 14 n=1 Tax=Salvia miltiorrhiza TaxID=226208 RepID=UPI0025ABBC5A|nr:probable WRKY transcription factor 14 [Salvia miltiorrhiza]